MKRFFIVALTVFSFFPIFASSGSEGDFKFIPTVKVSFIPPSSLDTSSSTSIPFSTTLEITYLDKYTLATSIPFTTGFFSKTKFEDNDDKAMFFTLNNPEFVFSYILRDSKFTHTFSLGCLVPVEVNDYAKTYVSPDKFFRPYFEYVFRLVSDPVSFNIGCNVSTGLPRHEENVKYADPLSLSIPFHILFAFNKSIAMSMGCDFSFSLPSMTDGEWDSAYISYTLPLTVKVIFTVSKNYFAIGISKDSLSMVPLPQIQFSWSIDLF